MRFSTDAPGSGHRGSVDLENATGSSHSNPFLENLEVRYFRTAVVALAIYRFLSVSRSDSRSSGPGKSSTRPLTPPTLSSRSIYLCSSQYVVDPSLSSCPWYRGRIPTLLRRQRHTGKTQRGINIRGDRKSVV